MKRQLLGLAVFLLLNASAPLLAQDRPSAPDPAVVGVEAATDAYLATVPADARARSDAYFEGGYWLSLWQFVWSSLVLIVLLHTGLSRRFRDAAARITGVRWLQPAIYWVAFLVFTSVLGFPLTIYAGFWREHQYGLATQTFGEWLGDQLKGLGLELVLGAVLVLGLYGVLQRTGRSWWIWGAAVTMAFLAFTSMIGPVYLAPVFNTYRPLQNAAIREPILSMAHANGLAATEVWEMDASRQTTRISANVSGMFGTERITLNDNLLKRASPAAVKAVMGHELGHYVLNHVYEMLAYFAMILAAGFALTSRVYRRLAERYRGRWGIDGIADPAGLPLIALILGAYLFLLTPVLNTIIRTNELEADMFGLNAARQPDGFAEAALLLADYRKLEPGPLEEAIFFDHPSGRTRIRSAMQWKTEQ
ncbi:MAG TPA: M48 family metallopeptidase [Vicinamibacterales bacterium]|nr:M48 family metallopeptidase [Vicinamibacterales bacterium]